MDERSLEMMNQIKNLESEYENKKREFNEFKRKELNRIAHEFLLNDYERRYNIKQEIMVSAITGEDKRNSEMLRQNKQQKVN